MPAARRKPSFRHLPDNTFVYLHYIDFHFTNRKRKRTSRETPIMLAATFVVVGDIKSKEFAKLDLLCSILEASLDRFKFTTREYLPQKWDSDAAANVKALLDEGMTFRVGRAVYHVHKYWDVLTPNNKFFILPSLRL